jgi:hypothetical protein
MGANGVEPVSQTLGLDLRRVGVDAVCGGFRRTRLAGVAVLRGRRRGLIPSMQAWSSSVCCIGRAWSVSVRVLAKWSVAGLARSAMVQHGGGVLTCTGCRACTCAARGLSERVHAGTREVLSASTAHA